MSFPQFAYSLANASTTPPSSVSASQMLLSPAPATPTSRSGAGCCETGRPLFTDPNTGQTVCSCQYPPGLLAAYPRLAGLSAESVYSSAYATGQTYLPLGADPSALYGSLEGPEALRSLAQGTPYYTYDPSTLAAYPYGYGAMDLNSAARRKNATRENTNTLKAWLYEHRKNPYPTKGEKIMLAIITKMTLTQVSTWFANARRRLKKENKMTWSPRTGSRDDDDDDDDDKNESDTETDRSNNNTNSNNGRCGASLDSPGGAGSTDTANKGGNILGKSDGMNSDGELHDEDEDEIIIDGGKEDDLLDDIDIENEEADSPSLNTHNAPRVSSGCVRKSPSPSTPGWTTHPRLSPSASSTLPNSSHRKESSHSEERKIEKCINNHKPNSQTMNKSSSSDGIKTCTTSESSASSKAKPRIWSLADVATSESPPQSSRRSPPCYPSPRDMVRPYPSQPLPAHAHGSATGINGLRSWLNGAAYMGGLPHPYLLTGATLGVDSRGIPVSTYGLLPTTSGFNPSATAASYTPQHKNTLGNEFKHETLKTSVSRERDEAAFKPINRRMPPS